MNIIYSFVEIFACIIEIYIAFSVFSIFFGTKRRNTPRYLEFVLIIIGVCIILICNSIALFSYSTIFIAWIYLSMSIIVVYKSSFISSLSITSFYLLCLNCMDFLVLTIVAYFHQGFETIAEMINISGTVRVSILLIMKSIWILVYLGIRKYLQKIAVNLRRSYLILVTSGIGFLGFMFMTNQMLKTFSSTMPVMWFLAIGLLFAVLFIIYFMVMQKQEEVKSQFLELRTEMLNEKYDTINESYKENAKLYHDLNNHLNVLYHFLQEEKLGDAKKYIEEISKPVLRLSQTVWTGVDVVDVVINSKLEKMQELNIVPDINVEFPTNSNILSNDLCSILSNIIDNAIEAVTKLSDNRYINITIRRINYFLFIRVVNPCNDVRKFDVLPTTTKEDKLYHGWGLKSVSDVVQKYNGTLECINEHNMFIVKIMLSFDNLEA